MKRIIRNLSAETKARISEAKRGKKFSAEHKKNLSNSLKKYWENIPTYQLVNINNNMKIGNINKKGNNEK